MEWNTLTYATGSLFGFVIAFQLTYIIITVWYSKKQPPLTKFHPEDTVSILIPAYNEEAVLESCLKGMLNLKYEHYETIFINDGSTDTTLETLLKLTAAEVIDIQPTGTLQFETVRNVYQSKLYENMYIIDKENGGKADSLNAGIAYAAGNIVITLDADSVLQQDSLLHINEGFVNPDVIAAGGMVQVGQMYNKAGNPAFRGKALLKYQLSEYLTSFYVRKFAQSKLKTLAIVSGAFGAFRREVLHEIRGYKKTLGEDMEITLNIQQYIKTKRQTAKLIFIPEAVCYTEVPENLHDLWKQRVRWQKGFVDCIVKYRKAFFRTLSVGFTLFLFWDSIIMAILGIMTVVMIPILLFTHKMTLAYLILVGISAFLQLSFRITTYWSATRYHHKYHWFDYVRVLFFFLLEAPIRPVLDMSIYVYGTLSYAFKKDKHDWNKVKRLGNVAVVAKKTA